MFNNLSIGGAAATTTSSTTTTTDPFIAEYRTVYDTFPTPPSESVGEAQNTMVSSIVGDGNWARIDAMWLFAGHTNGGGESLLQWKNPGGTSAAMVNAPTFTALEGFNGDGATSYINLQWAPSVDGSAFTQDAAAFTVATYSVGSSGSKNSMGCHDAFTGRVYSITNGRTILNSDFNTTGPGTGLTKFYTSAIRDGANSVTNYINKAAGTFEAVATNGFSGKEIYALTLNSNGSPDGFENGTLAAIVLGDFTSAQKDEIIDAIDVYMVSNGKGILP